MQNIHTNIGERSLRHASLFSGIGGFDLAAKWMGWKNIFSCECDSFCQKILKHHFPSAKHYGDIRELDGKIHRGGVDILTGGFPCQPFSTAGKRRGTTDDRFLWPEMLRIIREIQPTWVVAENVRGITSQGEGVVFERVCAEMEENGYDVQTFCIPAVSLNATHRRDRIWFIANLKCKRGEGDFKKEIQGEQGIPCSADERRIARVAGRSDLYESELCRGGDGVSKRLDALGNAVVPQIAYEIFKSISYAS